MHIETANNILINRTHNVDIINDAIAAGATAFVEAFTNAVAGGHSASIDVLKTHISDHNVGRLIACNYGNHDLVLYFSNATNHDECALNAAQQNHLDIFNELKPNITDNTGLMCGVIFMNGTLMSEYINTATNYDECLSVSVVTGDIDCINLLLTKNPTNVDDTLSKLSTNGPQYDPIISLLIGHLSH